MPDVGDPLDKSHGGNSFRKAKTPEVFMSMLTDEDQMAFEGF